MTSFFTHIYVSVPKCAVGFIFRISRHYVGRCHCAWRWATLPCFTLEVGHHDCISVTRQLYNSCLVFIKRCVWVVVMNIWIIFILECRGLGGVANINYDKMLSVFVSIVCCCFFRCVFELCSVFGGPDGCVGVFRHGGWL